MDNGIRSLDRNCDSVQNWNQFKSSSRFNLGSSFLSFSGLFVKKTLLLAALTALALPSLVACSSTGGEELATTASPDMFPEQIDPSDLGTDTLAASVIAARLALLEALDLTQLG